MPRKRSSSSVPAPTDVIMVHWREASASKSSGFVRISLYPSLGTATTDIQKQIHEGKFFPSIHGKEGALGYLVPARVLGHYSALKQAAYAAFSHGLPYHVEIEPTRARAHSPRAGTERISYKDLATTLIGVKKPAGYHR